MLRLHANSYTYRERLRYIAQRKLIQTEDHFIL